MTPENKLVSYSRKLHLDISDFIFIDYQDLYPFKDVCFV